MNPESGWWKISRHDPGAVKQPLIAQLSRRHFFATDARKVAAAIATMLDIKVELREPGARTRVEWSNPTLVHHGLAKAAAWHVVRVGSLRGATVQDTPIADLYQVTPKQAEQIAHDVADTLHAKVRLLKQDLRLPLFMHQPTDFSPNPRGGTVDESAARELELFIENDADLYRQQHVPILQNLWRKMKRGVYDHEKAVKLWMYLVDNGAKKYLREFGSTGYQRIRRIDEMFNRATRLAVARSLAETGRGQLERREFSWQAEPVRFKDLAVGQTFEFSQARYGAMPGPWRKTGAKTYESTRSGAVMGPASVSSGTVQVKPLGSNPQESPQPGEAWTTLGGGRCKVIAVTRGRVQVLHMETGNREWFGLNEFLSTYRFRPRQATRRNPRGATWHFDRFSITMPADAADDMSRPGQRADDSVEYWASRVPRPSKATAEALRAELKEYGAWDATELADDAANWQRILWIAAGNIREEGRGNPDTYWTEDSADRLVNDPAFRKRAAALVLSKRRLWSDFEKLTKDYLRNQPSVQLALKKLYGVHLVRRGDYAETIAANPKGMRSRQVTELVRLLRDVPKVGKKGAVLYAQREQDGWSFHTGIMLVPLRRGVDAEKRGGANPRRELSVPEKHQLKIARQTLRMRPEFARIMGGMTVEEAREVIRRLTGREPRENPRALTGEAAARAAAWDAGNRNMRAHGRKKWNRDDYNVAARELDRLLGKQKNPERRVRMARITRTTRGRKQWLNYVDGDEVWEDHPGHPMPYGLAAIFAKNGIGQIEDAGYMTEEQAEGRAPNPLPRWVDARSIRTVTRGKAQIRIGCPQGHYHPRAKGKRKCDVGTRAVERPRRKNPGGSVLSRAERTFRKWHEFGPDWITQMKGPSPVIPKTLVQLGELVSVTYESPKWTGKQTLYEHRTKRPRPVLATDPDGRHVYIVGGNMKVTADGLVN